MSQLALLTARQLDCDPALSVTAEDSDKQTIHTTILLLLLGHCRLVHRIARKFRGVKFLWKLIQLSFRDFIFTDSDPIAIINDKYSFAD